MATSIRLAPDIERRLHLLAEQTGRTKAYYLRQLIEDGLADLEERYLAEQRLIDSRAGHSKTNTPDAVRPPK